MQPPCFTNPPLAIFNHLPAYTSTTTPDRKISGASPTLTRPSHHTLIRNPIYSSSSRHVAISLSHIPQQRKSQPTTQPDALKNSRNAQLE